LKNLSSAFLEYLYMVSLTITKSTEVPWTIFLISSFWKWWLRTMERMAEVNWRIWVVFIGLSTSSAGSAEVVRSLRLNRSSQK